MLKLMIDRLWCVPDGAIPIRRTLQQDAERAKEIELKGWAYPRASCGARLLGGGCMATPSAWKRCAAPYRAGLVT